MLKNIKKIMVVAGLISAMLVSTAYASVPVQQVQTVAQAQAREGAWEQDATGQWKYSLNGVYVVNTWVESLTESGAWYFLNENGYMATNTYTVDGYYVNEQGVYRAGQTEAEQREVTQETEATDYASTLFDMGGPNTYTNTNIDWSDIQINSY